LIFLLFGAPGTGKSTYAEYIAQKTGTTWISTGNLLREEAEGNAEIKKTLESGQLIPDDKVDQIVFAKIGETGCNFILDGYPRTLNQMETFLSFLKTKNCQIDKIFHLSVPVEVVVHRMLSRGRTDDTPETVKERFDIFETETRAVINRFEELGIPAVEIDNTPPVEQVKKEFDAALAS
jgi:adenylate kinase